ncbi:carboxy-S-adenosyl-L-methionine synthase CmoA [Candidatus Riesia pediculicola]|uniref:Carboxy-S-adenosyl-L-methionine synthase n=1 Tax=Riesia pediculicola (strain USDA) TaxID=515618 RepID=D4G8A5_RIEPU|nr:carboxy-S-adenosyl-L-methionine synthase CmoA [Candidatus Riesia pediculicola]ADD79547.1 methyltransferase, putative [Candidatus Riesia pediculicola USDA]ARC53799.1 hypothetical protein AOE55_01380 [Candidatus Riesia pediculicola]QOJ86434.1 carboxy-S-adenosyl-L-methionine synthase CmoA [Candidatus Riesia pediculicola]
MKKKDNILRNAIKDLKDWRFDRKVSEVFHDMAHRSIPGYKNISNTIGYFSKKFIQPKSNIYDLGCSIGEVTESILKYVLNKNCTIISVDHSKDMIKNFKKRLYKKIQKSNSIKIFQRDILKIDIKNASIIVLNFTLQFIHPFKKTYVIDKIYQGLNQNGILILSEKIKSQNPEENKLFSSAYKNFKLSNGYSRLEVIQKERMLKNSMFLESMEQHRSRLKQSGFCDFILWFQYLNFISLIAFKR